MSELFSSSSIPKNPFELFHVWYNEAQHVGLKEPAAMILSTAANNKPNSRVVLLRDVTNKGFIFYTNYASTKAIEIELNPQVALNFYYMPISKQIRVTGIASKITTEQSDKYFAKRPRNSQIGAWASMQSSIMQEEADLEIRFKEYEEKFAGEIILRPPHWGGYEVEASAIEFWHEEPFRLHKRFLYKKNIHGLWQVEQLYP